MIAYDSVSFHAGQDAGTRVAACLARLAALELLDHARWWNRRRRQLMADALVACADELEASMDEGERFAPPEAAPGAFAGPALVRASARS